MDTKRDTSTTTSGGCGGSDQKLLKVLEIIHMNIKNHHYSDEIMDDLSEHIMDFFNNDPNDVQMMKDMYKYLITGWHVWSTLDEKHKDDYHMSVANTPFGSERRRRRSEHDRRE